MQKAATTQGQSDLRFGPFLDNAAELIRSAKDALVLDNLDAAERLLERLASQSATYDIRLPAYIRTEVWKLLRNHGMTHGLAGLRAAEKMLSSAVDALPSDAPRRRRQKAMRNLALLRAVIAARLPKTEELDHILATTSEEIAPLTWGAAQLQLGAIHLQHRRTPDAMECFEGALRVFTRIAHPKRWAEAHQRMAAVHQLQLAPKKAEESLKLALSVLTEASHPEDWAAAQAALGDAIMDGCEELGTTADIWTLVKAIAAYREAMRIYRRGTRPSDWARIQERLSHVELALADHPSSGIVRPHLRAALHHVQNAISAYESDAMTNPAHVARLSSLATRVQDRLSSDEATMIKAVQGRLVSEPSAQA